MYTEWYARQQKREQAALDVKLGTVRTAGEPPKGGREALPPSLFRGPVRYRGKFYPNTWKLTVNTGIALRPLCCLGPIDSETEWTILVPVIEVGNKYPAGVFEQAEARRLEVLADPDHRRREVKEDDDK